MKIHPSDATQPDLESLQKEKSFLKTLLRHLPDMIWMKDADGVYMVCNSRFERFFGASEAHIIGKTDYDFVSREQADFFRWHDLKSMNSQQPSVNEEWITLSSGEQCLLETTKTAIQDEYGKTIGVLGIGHDITKRYQSETAVRESSERYQAILSSTLDGFWLVDLQGNLLEVNDAYCRMSGYHHDELIGRSLLTLDPYETADNISLRIARIQMEGGDVFTTIHRRKDGCEWPVEVSISYSEIDGGRFFVFLRDISERRKTEQQIEYMAYNDLLTGLPNRVLLEDRLRQEIARHRRNGKRIAVLFMDLDGFKKINDLYGHNTGDQLLVAMAERMKMTFRAADTLARLGGDEFVAILPGLDPADDRLPILDRILAAIAEPITLDNIDLPVSASIGVSFYPQSPDVDGDQLLRQADQAMYQAKLAGKNRYHLFDTGLDQTLRNRHRNLHQLKQAQENHQLELFYQPKVNMRSGEVIGVEALMRWHHPEQGLLTPGHFLPAIEGQNFLIELGEWTLHQALQCMAHWQQQGIQLPVSINIAGIHLQKSDFMTRLLQILAEYPDVDPHHLELEVLETSTLDNLDQVSEVISACRKLGIRFALDDFGTGYSSLTYLKLLPTQVLKIDRSFVDEMQEDPQNLSILDSVISMATALKRQVIAEGVETIAQGETLLRLGCELGQGFAIAHPMPASDIPQWLQQWQPQPRWLNCTPLPPERQCLLFVKAEYTAWLRQLSGRLEDQDNPLLPRSEQLTPCPANIAELAPQSWVEIQQLHHQLITLSSTLEEQISNHDHKQASITITSARESGEKLLGIFDQLLAHS
jgi:diguanylate cyclase (GGDEF)-like protein/PAS domain S-box-containing protein